MGNVEVAGESVLVCPRKQEKSAGLETAGKRTRHLLAAEIQCDPAEIIPSRAQSNPLEVLFQDSLRFLGVSQFEQWDVLIFLHRHGVVLSSADQLARLLCYHSASIVSALDHLESHRLIQASCPSNGARFYKVMSSDDSRQRAFQQLISLTRDRAGRLMLSRILKLEAAAVPEVRSVTLSLKEVPNDRQ